MCCGHNYSYPTYLIIKKETINNANKDFMIERFFLNPWSSDKIIIALECNNNTHNI